MTGYEITALYIALNLIIAFLLAANVGKNRLKHKVSIGDGNNEDVIRVMRAHANFVEYAAIILPALLALAALGTNTLLLHLIGGTFTLSRFCHYLGMGLGVFSKGRELGTILTMLVMIGAAILLVLGAV